MTPSENPSLEIVCLVDDDPLVLRSTGLLLASDGFVVRQFDGGEDFIAYVASHEVPLVVLDIWMEEMTGLEVLARLCAISPQTHVVVITGREDAAARITAMQIGTVAFLMKPFDDEQFLEVVHRALGHPPGSSRKLRLSALDLVHNGSNRTRTGSLGGMKTHGSVVTNIAVCFTMLSPLICLIITFLGAWFFRQSSS